MKIGDLLMCIVDNDVNLVQHKVYKLKGFLGGHDNEFSDYLLEGVEYSKMRSKFIPATTESIEEYFNPKLKVGDRFLHRDNNCVYMIYTSTVDSFKRFGLVVVEAKTNPNYLGTSYGRHAETIEKAFGGNENTSLNCNESKIST